MSNSMSKGMNILVTGGNGFLGRHLCESLLKEGNHVTSLDNYVSSSAGSLDSLLRAYPNTLVDYEGDVRQTQALFAFKKFDEIYHLACPASPLQYVKRPIDTLMTCVVGTDSVLQLAKECGAKVLFTSTSEVYGDPEVNPQPETY